MNAQLQPIEPVSTELTIEQQAEKSLAFVERKARLTELAAKSVSITTITNQAGYQQCHAARMALKNERIDIEKTGKAARDDAVIYQRTVIAKERELVAIIKPEEDRLGALQEAVDRQKEAERLEAERKKAEVQTKIDEAITRIANKPVVYAAATADILRGVIEDVRQQSFEDFEGVNKLRAENARTTALATLNTLLENRIAADQAQAEKERQLAEEREAIRLESERQAAEYQRTSAIRKRIDGMHNIRREAFGKTSAQIAGIADVFSVADFTGFDEFEDEARTTHAQILAGLREDAKATADREQAERDRAERLRQEDEARAAEQERLRADVEAFEAQQKAEQERRDAEAAEARQREAEAQAQREREEAEQAEREAAERQKREAEEIERANLVDCAFWARERLAELGCSEEHGWKCLDAALKRGDGETAQPKPARKSRKAVRS